MKILYVISHAQLNPKANTGYGRHIRETIRGLQEAGHEVRVVKPSGIIGEGQTEPKHSVSDTSFIKRLIPSLIWESLRDIKQLKLNASFKNRLKVEIDLFQPDVIYERTCYMSDTVVINHRHNLRWYIEVNAPFVSQRVKLSGKSLLLWIATRMEKRKYALAHHVFCVSSVLKDFISDEYQIPHSKISVNHNGVNVQEFRSTLLTTRNQEFTFGFVGSIMPYHGIEDLILAFNDLYQTVQDIKLLIVGDGINLENLKNMVRELGISGKVEFTGSVPGNMVSEYIARMDVCILPNTAWYCSPVKIFEYGIMGKPIIAPKVKPVEEIIENGKDGILVSNQGELVNAMRFCLENRDEIRKIGHSFKTKVVTQYTWEANVERIIRVVQQI